MTSLLIRIIFEGYHYLAIEIFINFSLVLHFSLLYVIKKYEVVLYVCIYYFVEFIECLWGIGG